MSRSYKKNVKAFIATGDNREWYKDRRRKIRHKNKNNMREIFAHNNVEDANNLIMNDVTPKKDLWREPTDGHFVINKEIIKNMDRENKSSSEYYHSQYDKVLKPKHK